MMREIGHFVGGKIVKGTSGRFGDVFNPNTGEVQAKVALASKTEVEKTIANAEAAFPTWAATNPQRRARVMFKFLELIQSEYDDLARLLSSEHGKTFADSKGDIQRGLEVVEFACGIPHLMKGEFTESAGTGIDGRPGGPARPGAVITQLLNRPGKPPWSRRPGTTRW